jgi:DNA-binding NtrC family response regulator
MKTILVADDAAMIRELLKAALAPAGYRVLTAADGEEALAIFRAQSVDLSIIDVFLPKRDGLSVIAEMNRADRGHKIIAISGGEGLSPTTALELAEQYAVAETFTKPLDVPRLVQAVQRLVGE